MKSPEALNGLRRAGVDFTELPKRAIKHEWGLGVARTSSGEALLIIGGATAVDWDPAVRACLTPVAHSHPYFEIGTPRNRHGGVSTSTKAIADHDLSGKTIDGKRVKETRNRTSGAVLWSDLAERHENSEMQKIFPSASDIAFAANKNVRSHHVYTPYAVASKDSRRIITNPDAEGGKYRGAPRLKFKIKDAHQVSAEDGVYTCRLLVIAGEDTFDQMQVKTNGAGQFGALVW